MNLLKIAARVAAEPADVPGGMGEKKGGYPAAVPPVNQGVEIRLNKETGSYDFTMEEKSRDGDNIVLEVEGTDSNGRPFKGLFKVHLQDVVNFGGWDWEPLGGDLPAEPEAIQPILDAVGDEYGLTEDYGDGGEGEDSEGGPMDLPKIAARVAQTTTAVRIAMEITYTMPGDQDWDSGLWERLGVGGEWERLGKAFYNAGCEVDDTEDIVLTFDAKDEATVRKIVEAARNGDFGPDVQAYWTAAVEEGPDEDGEDPGPPSEPGSPYDTLEEKKGLK